jgi:hypothetical protein
MGSAGRLFLRRYRIQPPTMLAATRARSANTIPTMAPGARPLFDSPPVAFPDVVSPGSPVVCSVDPDGVYVTKSKLALVRSD